MPPAEPAAAEETVDAAPLPTAASPASPSSPPPPTPPPPVCLPLAPAHEEPVLVSIFAMLGVMTRVGLARLADYDGMPFFPSLPSTFLGCLLMGLLVSDGGKRLWDGFPGFATALGTGLCGCITSFGAWNIDANRVFVDFEGEQDGAGHQIVGALAILLVGLAVMIASLGAGRFLASSCSPSCLRHIDTLSLESRGTLASILTALAAGGVILGVLLSSLHSHQGLLFDIIFAPLGALLRLWLARRFNNHSWLPLGTLAANMLGTALAAAITVARAEIEEAGTSTREVLLQGVINGFCGSITTISTFAKEAHSMRAEPRHALIYVLGSILGAQAILFSILGSYSWRP